MNKDLKTSLTQKTENFLGSIGMTLPELLQNLGKEKSSLLNLKDDEQKQFSKIYYKIETEDCENSEKGKLLENLVALLFQKSSSSLFHTGRNYQTSTNDLDLFLKWTEQARLLGINAAYPCFGDSFICECKNYKDKVDVTYVGKFASLLIAAETKLGIMATWNGVTGRSKWSDAQGLIKKIALRQNIYIIVLDKNDFKRICDKKDNIFSIIDEKYTSLKNDIDYNVYIKKHETENILLSCNKKRG